MFCNKCGQGLPEGASMCPNCGNVLSSNNSGANSAARLKSTFHGGNAQMPNSPSPESVDVNKTYCMPVEFAASPAPAPMPMKPAAEPTYTPGSPYTPSTPVPSYSAGYGYSAPSPAHDPYHREYVAGADRAYAERKKGVGGRIARSILVSILFVIVLFGPMYDPFSFGGLFPDKYNNAFENFEEMDELFEGIEYYADRDFGEGVFFLVTSMVAFFMLMVSTVGSFISGLCNGKGAVRAFSVLGIVSIALYITALVVLSTASNYGMDVMDRAFDPDNGMFHMGAYASFVIFIVNCAIAGKD